MAHPAAQPAASSKPPKPPRQVKRDVPYVPSELHIVRKMFQLAQVQAGDTLYDLGCGDGRIAIAAAREHGLRAVGIDIDPQRIEECRRNAEAAGVAGQVEFVCGSLFDLDLRPASIVMLYLLPGLNQRLRPKLLAELRPGARVISNHFDMGEWRPDEKLSISWRHVFKWIIPAWVGGRWRCHVNHPAGRRTLVLDLSRYYQFVQGVAHIGPMRVPVVEGRLCGNELTFHLVEPEAGVVRYTATVDGTRLTGVCRPRQGEETSVAWGAIWQEPLPSARQK